MENIKEDTKIKTIAISTGGGNCCQASTVSKHVLLKKKFHLTVVQDQYSQD
jgi:hypothetical protein